MGTNEDPRRASTRGWNVRSISTTRSCFLRRERAAATRASGRRFLFQELLPRLQSIALAGPVEWIRSNLVNGIKRMPVRVETAEGVPARRRGAHTNAVPRADRHRARLRTISGCLVFLLAAATACTSESDGPRATALPSVSPSATTSADARARLIELGDAWLDTAATVTYRTVGAVDGQPTSTHQCLRQMVDTREDIVPSLRRCSRQGELELVWDPPERWRMEVTTPIDHFILVSAGARTRICPDGDPHACRPISTALASAEAGVDILFRRPEQILHVIGADEVHISDRGAPDSIAAPVECFRATGPNGHAEWCYTSDGVLVSLMEGAGVSDWTVLEATAVTPGVDPSDFESSTS